MNDVWRDFQFFFECLKSLKVSRTLSLDKGFCVSTGNEFENWVYYPDRVNDPEAVKKALSFFAERDEAFMWPVYNGGDEALSKGGLLHAGQLRAMKLKQRRTVKTDQSITVRPAKSADEWASCEWRAFEYGSDTVSREYIELSRAFFDDDRVSLFAAEKSGSIAGAFMTTNEADLIGVYYFATVPEYRRQGVATAMMNTICSLSEGKPAVLQAAPAGVPFYKAFGFDDLGAIEVYSTIPNIF